MWETGCRDLPQYSHKTSLKLGVVMKTIFFMDLVLCCSSAGRAGWLVIGRLLVQIPALGWAELQVEVSLGKILNPKLLLMCSWHLALLPSVRALRWAGNFSGEYPAHAQKQLGLAPAKPPQPHKRDKAITNNGLMDYPSKIHTTQMLSALDPQCV